MSHQETFLSQFVWRLDGSQNCTAKIGKQGPGKIFLEIFGQSGNKKCAATFLTTIYYIICDEF